jgi:hypothetical protein
VVAGCCEDANVYFWPKVQEQGGCWFWTAAVNSTGQPVFWARNRFVGAHRYAYQVVFGVAPRRLSRGVTCGNPECIHPLHVSVGRAPDKTRLSSEFRAAMLFWSRVTKTEGCWEWKGKSAPLGYGHVQKTYAHRRAWELHFGPIPDGLWVLHSCDNPICVNPSHLRLGTPVDNVRDRQERGRHRPRLSRVELNALLGDIRAGSTNQQIAARTGLSLVTIYRWRRRVNAQTVQIAA